VTLLWVVAALCVLLAGVLLLVRGRLRRSRLPLADVHGLGGAALRSLLLWCGVAGALVVCSLAFVGAGRTAAPGSNLLPPGADAIVVLDLSSSTSEHAYAIVRVLRALTRDGRRNLGLVLFSDTAYEALPPKTPADGLRGWLDVFDSTGWERFPWASYSSGTAISTGLVAARRAIIRDRVADPHVFLVTDLQDVESDLGRLTSVVAQYQREGIDLRVLRIQDQLPGTSALTAEQLENAAFVNRAASLSVEPDRFVDAAQPEERARLLAGIVALLAFLVAAYELAFHPLVWRPAR
jgi:hypothetical protein